VTLVCVPIGSGNWREARMVYDGRRTGPIVARVGETFTVAGVTWRVRRVEP
jgi:hypothetical protein